MRQQSGARISFSYIKSRRKFGQLFDTFENLSNGTLERKCGLTSVAIERRNAKRNFRSLKFIGASFGRIAEPIDVRYQTCRLDVDFYVSRMYIFNISTHSTGKKWECFQPKEGGGSHGADAVRTLWCHSAKWQFYEQGGGGGKKANGGGTDVRRRTGPADPNGPLSSNPAHQSPLLLLLLLGASLPSRL